MTNAHFGFLRRRVLLPVVSVLLPGTLGLAPRVQAQDTPPTAWGRATDVNGATSSGTAPWLGAWSPLRPLTDIPRGLLRAPGAPGVLDAPAPMAGAFVLSGAPGALGRDLRPHLAGDSARFGELRIGSVSERGAFRRPLDIAESQVGSLMGQGYSPVGARGIAIGRFLIDRESVDQSSFSERLTPYMSSAFVYTDSARPPMQRTRARLEGALGLRVGGFGLGVAAGVDSREHNSVDYPLRRSGRAATPAATLGVERVLPWAGLRVGGYYRWSEPTETNLLNAVPLPTILYRIQGYDEPFGVPVTSSTPLFVRIDSRATALGGTVEFTALGARVIVAHEAGDRAEDQYTAITQRDRPTDRWRASGSSSRVMVQRMMGPRVRATLVGARATLTGNAVRTDLRGIAVDGEDTRSAVEADVRVALSARWRAALVAGATTLSTNRTDYVAEIRSTIDATTPFVSAEVARVLGRASIAVGASAATTSPEGALPAASSREVQYRRLIAPALAYEAAEARAVAAWVTATMRLGRATWLASVRREQTTPTTVVASRLQPDGDRGGWRISLGVRP